MAVDPAELEQMIHQLEVLSDTAYAESLADCVMDPDPVEQAAFRSDPLAERSLAAAIFLIENVNAQIRRNEGESAAGWKHRAEHFRSRVGMERRLLGTVVDGIYARQGRIKNAPNPRRRAQERLVNLVLKGETVDVDTWRGLLEDERLREIERKRLDKERRKRLAKERKQAGRG